MLLLASGLALRAEDTPAQAAARAALEKKLQQLDASPAQPAVAAQPAVVAAPVATSAASAPAIATAPAVVVAPAVVFAPVVAPVPVVTTAPTNVITPVKVAAPAVVVAPDVAAPVINSTKTIAIAAPAQSTPARPMVVPLTKIPTPAKAPAYEKPSDQIVTIYGTIYRHVEVQKVGSDGLTISYWATDGGFEVTKLDYQLLPPNLRKQYEPRKLNVETPSN